MADIVVPDFEFSGLYYGQILEGLIQYKRANIPEISTENPFDPAIQLIRMFAYVSHLDNTLLDLVALESYIPTQQLRENTVNSFALIGFKPKADIPATTTLRARLSQSFTLDTTLIPDNARFSTRQRGLVEAVIFESDSEIAVEATNRFTGFHKYDSNTQQWTDLTTEANTLGAQPVTSSLDSTLYFGHSGVFPDRIQFNNPTSFDLGDSRPSDELPATVHLQFNDGTKEDATPSSVSVGLTSITFNVDSLFPEGGTVPQTGNAVWATLNLTGAAQRAVVSWTYAGGNVITITGFLGQTTPSTDVSDYTVGTYWRNVSLISNTTTAPVEVTRELVYTLPGAWTPGMTVSSQLTRWPLDETTLVTWYYPSGGIERVATLNLETGEVGGDAAVGTIAVPSLGQILLSPISNPDPGATFEVTYFRKPQWFQQTGSLTFDAPFDLTAKIANSSLPTEIRGSDGPSESLYWFRLLISSKGYFPLASPLQDLIVESVQIDQRNLYIQVPVTQGETVTESVGSGTSEAFQDFALSNSPVIEGSVELYVNNVAWTQVESLFSSTEFDEHYLVDIDGDGVATIRTGDGVNGRVVPQGVLNVDAVYRVNASNDGNVGSDTIVIARSGASTIRGTTNPQPATGWSRQQGADLFALEQMKREGTAYLRTLQRGVSPYDIEYLSVNWSYNNSKPFSRARAVENGFGRKTIKLIVVPTGGGTSTTDQRVALGNYLNGDLNSGGVEPGIGLSNREVRAVDYTPREFVLDATITGGSESAIRAFLQNTLQPEAVETNLDYRWRFGQLIPKVILASLIKEADSNVENIVINQPANDLELAEDELPKVTTINLTFV